MLLSKKWLVGAAVALAVVAGSAAYAAVPDAGGVIHGCYAKDSGALRVTDTATNSPKPCTNKEVPLNWNQLGPGAASQASTVIVHRFMQNGSITIPVGYDQLVTSLSVPPTPPPPDGQPSFVPAYLVTVKAVLGVNVANPQTIGCRVWNNNQVIDESYTTLTAPAGAISASQTITLTGIATFVSSLDLKCTGAKDYGIGHVVMTATPMSNIVNG